MLKFGSNTVFGLGASMAPANENGCPAGNVISVAMGPPSGWSSEYKCQPGWIRASSSTVKRAPRGRGLTGDVLPDHATGSSAATAATADADRHANTQVLMRSRRGSIRLHICCLQHALAVGILHECNDCNVVNIE